MIQFEDRRAIPTRKPRIVAKKMPSTATIADADFLENTAASEGGAVSNSGVLTLAASRLDLNSGGSGGGVYNSDRATVKRCTLTRNQSRWGGAIMNSATLSLESSTLDDNDATGVPGAGGGIATSATGPAIQTDVRDSTLSNNSAERGGAISNIGELKVFNSTFSANMATAEGGGVFNRDGNSLIGAATFYGNNAPSGGGIYNIKTAANESTVTVAPLWAGIVASSFTRRPPWVGSTS